jgi:hypothetical protein
MGHSPAAGVIYATLDEDGTLRGWRRLLVAVELANAADLDLLPGLLVGCRACLSATRTGSIAAPATR